MTKEFKHNFYNFLRCRSVCNFSVCLVGIYYQRPDTICENCRFDFNWINVNWFAIALPLRVFFMASFISDNLIVLNRLANLYDKKTSTFYKLSKRVRSRNQVFGDQFWSKKNKVFNYLVL